MGFKLPRSVQKELCHYIDFPDEGVALIAENVEDVCAARRLVDFERHPAEWVNRLEGGFLSALFVMNNSFTIALFLPAHIAPAAILRELEE